MWMLERELVDDDIQCQKVSIFISSSHGFFRKTRRLMVHTEIQAEESMNMNIASDFRGGNVIV